MEKLTEKQYIAQFDYAPDKVDGWTVTTRGDCDDFALSMAWILSGHSYLRLAFNIAVMRVRFLYVSTPRGEAHLVLGYKGQYIDNINPTWRESHGYKRIFPWTILPPIALFKILIGAIFRRR